MKKYVFYLIPGVIVLLAIMIYWNTLNHDFVNFDDPDLIIRNRYIKTLSFQNIRAIFTPGVVGAYQPVRTLSYAIDYHFWKLDPTGYHLTNVLCHAVSTLLVYLIAFMLTRQVITASVVSLVFAVHPVHVEAVAWVAGRRDVLSSAFGLLSVFCFLRFSPAQQNNAKKNHQKKFLSSAFWYAFALVFFGLGLLTKSSLVILPLLFVLYDLCFLHPPIWEKWQRGVWYLPFFLISLIFTQVFTKLSRSSGLVESWGNAYTRSLTMTRVFAEYIYLLCMPKNLSATYGITSVYSLWGLSFLMAFAVIVLILVLTVYAWKNSKLVVFGVGWFFISLLPVSNIIPIAITKADRYLYLPSVGFCLVLAWLIVRCWTMLFYFKASAFGKHLVAFGYWLMIGLIIFSYALYTVQRNRDWKDSHTLWTATLETNPDSSIALNNLGLIYVGQGMYEKAIALYERLLAFHPDQEHVERVYGNMADAYAGMQMFGEAINHYQKALDIDPEYLDAYLGLASVSMKLGQHEKAESIYKIVLELDDQNELVYLYLGNLYAMQGKYDEAIDSFKKTLERNPFSINAFNGLGLSYAWKGETDKALNIYRQTLRQYPESTVIRNSLGTLYMQLGEPEKAIAEFSTSLEAEPENVEVRNNLGILYLRIQRYKEAAREFITCLKYQANNPKILSNLGNAYVYLGLYDEAIQMYQWAVELDPSLFRTYLLLGDLCFGIEQTACAIEAYQGALKLQPENQKVLEQLEAARQKAQENKTEKKEP